MDLDQFPAAVKAAAERVQVLADTLPAEAAAAVLDAADPPRRTGALADTGRVEAASVVYGGGLVDYAAPVHSRNPWLDVAAAKADDTVADLADARLAEALTL